MAFNPQDCRHEVKPFTLAVNTTGNLVNTAYPQLKKLAEMSFNINYALVGLQLTSSLTAQTGQVGVYAIVGNGAENLAVSQVMGRVISHLSNVNTVAGLPGPATRVSSFAFGDYGMRVDAGTKLCLYGFSGNDAANILFAEASFYLVEIK